MRKGQKVSPAIREKLRANAKKASAAWSAKCAARRAERGQPPLTPPLGFTLTSVAEAEERRKAAEAERARRDLHRAFKKAAYACELIAEALAAW